MQKNAINPISAVKNLASLGRRLLPNSVGSLSQLENSKIYNNPVFRAVTDVAIPGVIGYETNKKLTESYPDLDPTAAALYSLGIASAASPRDLTNALIQIKSGPGSPAFASQFMKNILPQVKTKALFGGLATVPMLFDISQDVSKTVAKGRETAEQLTAKDPETNLTAAEQFSKAVGESSKSLGESAKSIGKSVDSLGSSVKNVETSGKLMTDELGKFFAERPDPNDPTGKGVISPVESLRKGLFGLGQTGSNLDVLTGKDNPLTKLVEIFGGDKSPLARIANSAEKITGLAESGKNYLKRQNPAYIGAGLGAAAGLPLAYLVYRVLQQKKKDKAKSIKSRREKEASSSPINKAITDSLMPPSGTKPSNLTLYGAPLAVLAARAAMGAGIGAGANYMGNYLVPDPDETDEQRQRRLKRSLLIGTGVGLGSGAIHAADIYGELKNKQNLPSLQPVELQKKAKASLGKPGMVSSALADTIGRAMSVLNIVPMQVAGLDALRNPRAAQEQPRHEEALNQISSAYPDALNDVKLRLGAPDIVDDMLWKDVEDKNAPWFERAGGRVLQNKRSGPLGKMLGWPTTPARWLLASLMRSPHYDPYSDVAHNMIANRAVTEHELGHAIDFNTLYDNGKVHKDFSERLIPSTVRDLYGLSASIPFVNLHHENQANELSRKALLKVLKSKPEYVKRILDRNKVLPAAYGSYIGSNIGGLVAGPAGAAVGPIIGAASSGAAYSTPQAVKAVEEAAEKEWDAEHSKSKKSDKDKREKDKQAASRCWTGYEPVPGKTPYSEDSCRPVGSKPKKKEKKAANCCSSSNQKCDNCGNAPCDCNSDSDPSLLAKVAAVKLIIKAAGKRGLWDNIHAKRKRGESPAKPGEKDYPDSKSWNATVKAGAVDKLISLLATGRLKQAEGAWTRAEGKSESGGLNAKGRASLKAQGHDIKPPVTEDNPTGERAGRKASFCARMSGMKKKLTSKETASDPDSRINKSLRKWNC